MSKLLFTDNDWSPEAIDKSWRAIEELVSRKYNLSYYKPKFEIVSLEQMLDVYTSSLPDFYSHWSLGKKVNSLIDQYKAGHLGLAYEVVFNTDPSICFLMEQNTMTIQTLVMAHAAVGHASFFKNNYLFKEHTHPKKIMSTVEQARHYIEECEKKHGIDAVETLLDSCHALSLYSFDRYRKPYLKRRDVLNKKEKMAKNKEEIDYELYDSLPEAVRKKCFDEQVKTKGTIDEENILWVMEKMSPSLKKWERRIVRYYRKIQQYLYPQFLTKVMNEGWASFWHYRIMEDLYDEGRINESSFLEFLDLHSKVIVQLDYLKTITLNPYKIGFEIWNDIYRICTEPDDEDREYNPEICDTDPWETMNDIVETYQDNGFIRQYLGPKVIRKMKMFTLSSSEMKVFYDIDAVASDDYYDEIAKTVSAQLDTFKSIPDIRLTDIELKGERRITLTHYEHKEVRIDEKTAYNTIQKLFRLWDYGVDFKVLGEDGTIHCHYDEEWEHVDD